MNAVIQKTIAIGIGYGKLKFEVYLRASNNGSDRSAFTITRSHPSV